VQGSTLNQSESTVFTAKLNYRDENRDLLSVDIQQESGRLCYALTLLIPGMRLTVGHHTSLSLLLKSTMVLVRAPLFTLTHDQLHHVVELQKKLFHPSFKPLVMDIPDEKPDERGPPATKKKARYL